MRLFCNLGFFAFSGGFRVLRISKSTPSPPSPSPSPSIPAAIASQSPKMKIHDTLQGFHEHSLLLSNFSLRLRNLQAHFLSIERMFDDRLKSLESVAHPPRPPPPGAPRHPELKPICVRMDHEGLNSFVRRHRDKLRAVEFVAALRVAPDPAQLVLNSMQRFYPTRMKNFLVDWPASISPEVKEELRKNAELTAEKWRATIGKNGEHAPECFAFLQVLALFRLDAEFDADELAHRFIVHVPKDGGDYYFLPSVWPFREDSCHSFVADVITKLSEAICIELKAHTEGIKYIDEHNLEPECPLGSLVKEIEHLEKERAKLAAVKAVIK
ncbi:hypothetical protein ACLOJK_035734 [Asimina triloba]